mmetsp:Transcript_4677/g.13381  ORF Transcript_4677/g.13381 Transcript_4677/m.13381 type:complete len:193 (+) Transcript_4677:48-626(+)
MVATALVGSHAPTRTVCKANFTAQARLVPAVVRTTPLMATFSSRACGRVVCQAVNVNAAASAAEKVSYETMVVLRPDLTDEQRDSEVRLWPKYAPAKYAPTRTHSRGQPTRPLARQLAKFEAFLQKSGAEEIQVTIRGRQRLAYPIKTFADGIYVLYTYDADPQVVAPVQKLLSTPTAGAELNVLRHMTFRI